MSEPQPIGPAEKAEIIDQMYEKNGLPGAVEACSLRIRDVMAAIDDDPEFADQVEKVMEHLAPLAEQELFRRAVHGTESVVVSQGRVVMVADEDGIARVLKEKKYSDTLLTKFLEARNRPVFGPKVEIQHKHEGFIAVPVMDARQLQAMLSAPGDDITFLDAEFEDITDTVPLAVSDMDTRDINPDVSFDVEPDAKTLIEAGLMEPVEFEADDLHELDAADDDADFGDLEEDWDIA